MEEYDINLANKKIAKQLGVSPEKFEQLGTVADYSLKPESMANKKALQSEDIKKADQYPAGYQEMLNNFKNNKGVTVADLETFLKNAEKTAAGTDVDGKLSFLQKCKNMVKASFNRFVQRHNENLTPNQVSVKPVYFTARTTEKDR